MHTSAASTATKLVNLAFALALVVVFLGAWTRINDAGLGCPDWPTCYGEFVMPVQQAGVDSQAHMAGADVLKAWLEMIHRYAAGVLGLLVLVLMVMAWRHRAQRVWPVRTTFLLGALILLQAAFGMWTVTLKLVPWIVTLHLIGGLTILTLLYFLRAQLKHPRERQESLARRVNVDLRVMPLLVVLAFQLVLGGWTSTNYAGAACSHWFFCHANGIGEFDFANGLNPAMPHGPNYEGGLLEPEARAAIQVTHRFGALAVVLLLIMTSVRMRAESSRRVDLLLCWALCLTQIALGMLNVVMFVPVHLAFLHHVTAVLLWLAVLRMALPRTQRQPYRELYHGNKITA